eukprot:m.39140 g.39140  ORF g.39140 m.39140 type:complete len:208 (+) comp9513_c0_seq1:2027-2650(+)
MLPENVTLKCVPDCGFWPEFPAASGKPIWQESMAKMTNLHNSSGGFDVSCVSDNMDNPSFCAHPPNVVPYLETPTFISTSHQDTDATSVSVLADGRGDGYLHPTVPPSGMETLVSCFTKDASACTGSVGLLFQNWTNTITSLLPNTSTPHGWFVNRCYRHHNIDGNYTFETYIDNVSLIEAIGTWAKGSSNNSRFVDTREPTLACLN